MVHLAQRAQGVGESQTLAITAKAQALRMEGIDVVSFGAGEPDFDTPDTVRQQAIEAIQEGFTRYTPSGGILPLKQAIAKEYELRHQVRYAPSEILVSAGAKQSLYNFFMAVVDPGDEVLIPAPCWTSYPDQVKLAGGVPVFVPSGPGFALDPDAIRARITPRSKVLVINSPSNPTGCVYTADALEATARLARERGLLVVSDEIYEHLVYGGREHTGIVARYDLREQGVIVSGVSKTYAMTGWRIGWTLGPAEIVEAMGRIQSHSTSCPSSISQRAALAALLADSRSLVEPMVREFDKRRLYMISRLKDMPGVQVDEPHGAFYAFPRVSKFFGRRSGGTTITNSASFAHALLEAESVAVVPGSAFEADEHIRLSYATGIEEIEKGLDRLGEFLGTLR